MRFGPTPLTEAEGAILAHSLRAGGRLLKKGTSLGAADLAALRAAGHQTVVAARLEPGDVPEDLAAERLGEILANSAGLRASPPKNGRVNLHAETAGLLTLDEAAIAALNGVDPGITLATLAPRVRVAAGAMLATVKIIPYAVPRAALDRAVSVIAPGTLALAQPRISEAALLLTRTPGFKESLLSKGEAAVTQRLDALGVRLSEVRTVPHETDAVAAALAELGAPLRLILGASATSDAADVCPAGLVAAGGSLTRFGMPVDPGNLLFLGQLPGAHVVGLPGCARSPALNGADWVLERLVCGLDVGDTDIAAMGVGGLLKEIPLRPQPRFIPSGETAGPKVEILLLAAGAGRRMRGRDKLLEPIQGRPLLRRIAEAARDSRAHKVTVVLPPDQPARAAALAPLDLPQVIAKDAAEGMGASLRAGMAALGPATTAVIVALADMPEIGAADFDALIEAYDPAEGREIIRAASADGRPGHPVLFGHRFFEALSAVEGDVGARAVVASARSFVHDVPRTGEAALTDLDTPEAWDAWRARRSG